MAKVSWNMLLTESLLQCKTQYINRVPKILLKAIELEHVEYLAQCSKDGYIPSLETFKEDNIFLTQTTEIPLKVLFEKFTNERRDEVVSETIRQHIENNGDITGITDVVNNIYNDTRIPNPEIIDYGKFDREQLDKDIKRISTGIPHFDNIFGGVLKSGEILCLLGGTKTSKTTVTRLIAEMMYYGHGTETSPGSTVLMFSQEMSTVSMLESFDYQRLAKNSANSRSGIDNQTMQELRSVQQEASELEQKLYIAPPVSTAQQIKDYFYTCEVRPDVVFIDGFNLLSSGENSFVSIGTEMKLLKEFAIKEQVIIIGNSQLNRTGIKEGINANHTSIGSSIAIAFFCDFLINMTPVEIMLGNDGTPTKHVYFRPTLCRSTACDPNKHFLIEWRYTDTEFLPIFKTLAKNWSPDELYLTQTDEKIKKSMSTELQQQLNEQLGEKVSGDTVDAVMDLF